jgi:hypothetical protein
LLDSLDDESDFNSASMHSLHMTGAWYEDAKDEATCVTVLFEAADEASEELVSDS